MGRSPVLHLLEGYGVEVEYVIVKDGSLDILPVSDEVLKATAGSYTNEVETGEMGWSNEFVKHVMEIRNSHPAPSLSGISVKYQAEVERINRILELMGGRLMPTSMHPWMDPKHETVFWNRKNRRIYQTYDRIFGCRTHGWANIQSTQINLSFSGDEEFGRLHAAVRLVLPIIPALAASSPICEGKVTGALDNRLTFYHDNQHIVPSISGAIIPERVFSIETYKRDILERMYRDIAPHDPDGILQHEWLNSRGAIPRYDRSAIEVRIPDIQECPLADMAVMAATVAAVKTLTDERFSTVEQQKAWDVAELVNILQKTMKDAEGAVIDNTAYLGMFGMTEKRLTAGELWHTLIERALPTDTPQDIRDVLQVIAHEGTLSRRILRALEDDTSRERIRDVYGVLCQCLATGALFHA